MIIYYLYILLSIFLKNQWVAEENCSRFESVAIDNYILYTTVLLNNWTALKRKIIHFYFIKLLLLHLFCVSQQSKGKFHKILKTERPFFMWYKHNLYTVC